VTDLIARLNDRISSTRDWPCTCGGAELARCDRCLIVGALATALDHVQAGEWADAYRAIYRAAAVDHQFDDLCRAIKERANKVGTARRVAWFNALCRTLEESAP